VHRRFGQETQGKGPIRIEINIQMDLGHIERFIIPGKQFYNP